MCYLTKNIFFFEKGIQEILHKTSIPQDQPTRTELNWTSTTTESPVLLTSMDLVDQKTTATITSAVISPIEPITIEQESIPAPVSSSYVIPGSGSLKETHIYTPDIVSSNSSLPGRDSVVIKEPDEPKCPDFDYDKAAAGIIINENVVKKEYRDIEYNPVIIPSNASQLPSSDDFSDFQYASSTTKSFSNYTTNMDILQPTGATGWLNSSTKKSNEIDLLSASLPTLQNSKSNIIDEIDLKLDNFCTNENQSNDNYAKPRIGISPTDNMFETTLINPSSSSLGIKGDDDFTEFQSVSTTGLNSASSKVKPILPISQPLAPVSVISQKSSNTAVLTPQTIKPSACPSSSNINWPDPGINPDELARLEAIFTVPNAKPNNSNQSTGSVQSITSTKKVPATRSEDDEWTDFVSSTPKPQPITQIINENINKLQKQSSAGDDDDWTDFVSSTPPVVPQLQPLSLSNQWTSGPNFTSWNAPPQFNSWQSSTIYKPPQPLMQTIPFTNQSSLSSSSSSPKFSNYNNHNNSNNNNSSYRPSQTSNNNNNNANFLKAAKAPSISLIPDLSFIAPKNLMNRGSRTNYPTTTKK